MELKITRKCFYCKDQIELNDDNYIYIKDKYYHFNCAIDEQLNKKRNKLTKDECIDMFKDIQDQNKKELKDRINKEKLFRWLQKSYDTVFIPKYFFIKMDSVFNGTYKGLSIPIPPEDLLDMWKRKKSELDSINEFNKRKGQDITGSNRIQYDLAILLSKYDSYLKWKEKQKLLEEINEPVKQKIDYKLIHKTIENNKTSDTNINNLLEEVF